MAYKKKYAHSGRPRTLQSVEQFERLASAYFDKCKADGAPLTVSGLALACGVWRRKLLDYEKEFPEFTDAIKLAKGRCEEYAEQVALTARNPGGAIFILKNYGWTDKTEIEHTGQPSGPLIINLHGLYGQPGDVPLPAGAVFVQRGAIKIPVPVAATTGDNGGNGGNGGNGTH